MFSSRIEFHFVAKKDFTFNNDTSLTITNNEDSTYEWQLVTYCSASSVFTKITLNSHDELCARLLPMLNMLNFGTDNYESMSLRAPGFPELQFGKTKRIPVEDIYQMILQVLKNWNPSTWISSEDTEDDSDSMPELIPLRAESHCDCSEEEEEEQQRPPFKRMKPE